MRTTRDEGPKTVILLAAQHSKTNYLTCNGSVSKTARRTPLKMQPSHVHLHLDRLDTALEVDPDGEIKLLIHLRTLHPLRNAELSVPKVGNCFID